MSDSKNSKINEGIIDPSVKKSKVITMYTADMGNVYILSKQPEASMRVTPD